MNFVNDLHSVLDDVLELDLFERAKVSRPDSAWGVLQQPGCFTFPRSNRKTACNLRGIDMFKDGLATKWLFKESDTKSFSVPLITKQNADLHSTIWNNLVSGPSLVFHRFYEKGKTFIKQEKYQSETLTYVTEY